MTEDTNKTGVQSVKINKFDDFYGKVSEALVNANSFTTAFTEASVRYSGVNVTFPQEITRIIFNTKEGKIETLFMGGLDAADKALKAGGDLTGQTVNQADFNKMAESAVQKAEAARTAAIKKTKDTKDAKQNKYIRKFIKRLGF